MHVQVNSDSTVSVHEEFARRVARTVESTLSRFSEQITRVEVHLSDVNASKGGTDDKRCTMEARLAGMQPIAVSDQAGTIQQAIDGATGKMERALENAIGKRHHRAAKKPELDTNDDVSND